MVNDDNYFCIVIDDLCTNTIVLDSVLQVLHYMCDNMLDICYLEIDLGTNQCENVKLCIEIVLFPNHESELITVMIDNFSGQIKVNWKLFYIIYIFFFFKVKFY